MKVHIQREFPLIVETNVVDLFRKQRLIADAHCVDLVVKLVLSHFRKVSSQVVSHFSHCEVRTVGFCFAELAVEFGLGRLSEFQLL